MSSTYIAIFGSCVFYSAPLRDLFIELALTDLFRARWTAQIHDEWMRAVVRDGRATVERAARTRSLIDSHAEHCLVYGYEELVPALELPDPDDRHVLAAAIVARADVIVTLNLKDFPSSALERYGVEAQTPDEFALHQVHLNAPLFCEAVATVRGRLRRPEFSVERYFSNLERVGLKQTVAVLRSLAAEL